jgi:hypothetical protein
MAMMNMTSGQRALRRAKVFLISVILSC